DVGLRQEKDLLHPGILGHIDDPLATWDHRRSPPAEAIEELHALWGSILIATLSEEDVALVIQDEVWRLMPCDDRRLIDGLDLLHIVDAHPTRLVQGQEGRH